MPTEPKKEGAPSTDTPPPRAIDDPLLGSLLADLEGIVQIEKAKDEPPKAPDIKPADEKPAAGDPPKDGVKVGVKPKEDARAVANKVFDERMSQLTPPPLPPKKEEKKDDPPKDDDKNLTSDQVEELEDAKFADQSGKRAEAIRDFYKKTDEFAEKWRKEHGGADPTGNDEEFVNWVKVNKPKWADGERDKIRYNRIAERVKAETKRELQPEIDKAERAAREATALPAIEKMTGVAAEKLSEQLQAGDDKLAAGIYKEFSDSAAELVTSYLRLVQRVDTLGDEKKKPIHDWLINFIAAKGEEFARAGGDKLTRDGKTFLPPQKFAELRQKQDPSASKHWTFGYNDVIDQIVDHSVSLAKQALSDKEKELQALGYERRKSASNPNTDPKKEEPVTGTQGIKTTSTPAPGAADTSKDKDLTHPGIDVINALGMDK